MPNIKIHCPWDLAFDLEHNEQIELYVDYVPSDPIPYNTKRFIFILEPVEILNLNQQVLSKQNNFDYVLTHNQDLLDECPKAVLFPFASTWIKNYSFPEKEFGVSTLVGGKLIAPGHILRQKVWYKQNKITIPKKFFMSGNFSGELENFNNNPVLEGNKNSLFDTQFHIVIENSTRRNWFTEKLIDTVITKTVPIYWGCTNIGDWFNTDGFFIVNDVKEIIDTCNSITENTYNNMIDAVEENYKISLGLADIGERLKNKIIELL